MAKRKLNSGENYLIFDTCRSNQGEWQARKKITRLLTKVDPSRGGLEYDIYLRKWKYPNTSLDLQD